MTSIFESTIPAGAFDDFVGEASAQAALRPQWTAEHGPLPVMYLSHGAPPLLDDAGWMRELFAWAQHLPQPKAILIVSAHWEAAPLSLSSTAANTTPIYDFGGFAPRYYTLRYDTPDASDLARLVHAMTPDGEQIHQHQTRGLDHGAWVPLKVMYPDADIPVLQLSLPTHDPKRLLALGGRLRALREEGVLIIGSGFMTHGLPFLTREMVTGQSIPAWSSDFDAWATDALHRGDVDELANYQSSAPGMPYAHPTVEHFIPLFVALGAATYPEAAVEPTITGYWAGLSKGSFQAA